MDALVLIGRVLFSALFLGAAARHLIRTKDLARVAAGRGVPLPWLATLAGGIVLALGGLSVLLGVWADLGALLLATFLGPTALLMHAFWKDSGDTRQEELTAFTKDLALAGAALALAGLFAFAGDDLGLTLTGPLLSRK